MNTYTLIKFRDIKVLARAMGEDYTHTIGVERIKSSIWPFEFRQCSKIFRYYGVVVENMSNDVKVILTLHSVKMIDVIKYTSDIGVCFNKTPAEVIR